MFHVFRHLAHKIGFTIGRQVSAGLLALISLILIARLYGPVGSGTIAVALLLPNTLVTFLSLGIAPANVYFIASSQVSVLKAFRTTLRLGGLICCAGTAIGIVVIYQCPHWFTGVSPSALWLSLAIFPPTLFSGLICGLFQAQQDFELLNKLSLLQPSIQFVLFLPLILFRSPNPSWVLLAILVSHIAALGVCFCILKLKLKDQLDIYPGTYMRKALSYGGRTYLDGVFAFVNNKADVFLVNIFLGPASAGLYVVAVNVAERLWILAQASTVVIAPKLSELSVNPKLMDELTPSLSRWILAATSVSALLVAVITPSLLPFVFGLHFQGSVSPLLYLLPGIIAGSASRILAADVAARGRPELNMVATVFVAVINVTLNILLIPSFGLSGAAVATTISYATILALRLWMQFCLARVSPISCIFLQPSDLRKIKQLFG